MGDTCSYIYIQFIFAVRYRMHFIHHNWKLQLYRYISMALQHRGHKMFAINGVKDNIHIFCGLHPAISISSLIKDVKLASFSWRNRQQLLQRSLALHEGDAASYIRSHLPKIYRNIARHEKNVSPSNLKKEYLAFLRSFNIEFKSQHLCEFHT